MKRIRLFSLFVLMAIFALPMLVGCKKDDRISSVYLKDHDPAGVIEMTVGAFDYGAHTLVVSYDSGNTEEIALTEDMIAQEDLFKFYREGEHDITVSYAKQKYVFRISVKRSEFGELALPQENVFTYDGKAHTVEVTGDMPANAVVTYPGGNSFINAGTYDVTAIVSCDGYVTVKLNTTVKIERARYDMSGVRFDAKEFVYDGQSHSVSISGTLPEGVSSPTYIINDKVTSSAIDAGEYKVTAKFANNNPNYETIPDMETTLTIKQAEYSLKGLDLVFKTENGNVINGVSKVYDGSSVIFDLNDYARVPGKVSVSFAVYDQDGNRIATSNKNTNIKNAGVYTVKVEFTPTDNKNYKLIAPLTRTFEVKKADYSIETLKLDSAYFVYDGKEHSIILANALPENLTVSYEYYLDQKLMTDGDGNPVQSVTNAGRYTVKAILTHSLENYKEIAPLTAVLQIDKAQIDVSHLMVPTENTMVYDGKAHSMTLVGDIPAHVEIIYEYYRNNRLVTDDKGHAATSVSDVGEYMVIAIFTVTNENYASLGVKSMTFSIQKAIIDLNGSTIVGNESCIYDGTDHRASIENLPEGVNIRETLYMIDGEGNRAEVTSAVDCGKYVQVFTMISDSNDNYEIVGDTEREWAFSVLPQTIDISGIEFENTSFVYNGNHLCPTVIGIPEHVSVLSMIYYALVDSEMQPTDAATEVGMYRLLVILTAENGNYVLSTNAPLMCDFEIKENRDLNDNEEEMAK